MKIKSIKTKVIGLIFILGLILSIFLAVIAPRQARDLAQDILSDNARLFGRVLAADLSLGIQTIILDDGAAIVETLEGLHPDDASERVSVANAWVYDQPGALVASLNTKATAPNIEKVTEYLLSDLDNVFRMSSPLVDDEGVINGYMVVDLSKEYFLSQTASNRSNALLLALVAMILSIVSGYFLARSIGKPLIELTKAADQVVTGDIDLQLSVRSDDELGRLTNSFLGLISYIRDIAGVAERIAQNDLTVRIKPRCEKDILGKAFSNMISNLSGIVEKLSESVTLLSDRASEITSSAEAMTNGTRKQVDQFNQVGSAIEEMTATIIESSKNATEASQGAENATNTANKGGQIVGESIKGMQAISEVVKESADSIKQLAGSAHQIGDIVSVIEDIADQTNLLALNAAIEAARAGEQGRGFAVVADEVRKLAERTAKATGEITSKIKGIQQETDQAVKGMDVGITKVEEGRSLADRAGDSLNEIVNVSQQVMDMIQMIATASTQQSAAAEEISLSVENVADISQQSASEAKKSAEVADKLNEQAFELNDIVSRFKISK